MKKICLRDVRSVGRKIKMNPIDILKQEHEDIERELIELETIIEDMNEGINYPNLIHVYERLCKLWNEHEQKENKLFPIMEKEKIKIPVEEMLFEHKLLKPHRDALNHAIKSGNESELKKALDNNCVVIIKKLRQHISDEDEILYTITMEEFTPKEIMELWESLE